MTLLVGGISIAKLYWCNRTSIDHIRMCSFDSDHHYVSHSGVVLFILRHERLRTGGSSRVGCSSGGGCSSSASSLSFFVN